MYADWITLESTKKSYLDFSSLAETEKNGSFLLRQDIRLLPNMFDVGMSEFIELALSKDLEIRNVDYFLCHYSSEKFSDVVKTVLDKAGLTIPTDRWFSNLKTRGNTGAASIFIMLEEFLKTHELKADQKILCFIPESGRFTVSYLMFEVVKDGQKSVQAKPALPEKKPVEKLLLELGSVWHNYRSTVFRSELANRIFNGTIMIRDYQVWMENWIPQVREGSVRMCTAISNLTSQFEGIQELIEEHAGEEQFDFKILYADYQNSGGQKALDDLRRNSGGEALNDYMYAKANSKNPLGLLGGIFIIEGIGQKIIPTLLPFLKRHLGLQMNAFKFLEYHGENDVKHLERWAQAVKMALTIEPSSFDDILENSERGRGSLPKTVGACAMSANYLGHEATQHDPNDPNPWHALYLDQNTPIRPSVKDKWLRDSSSLSRQYLLPFARSLSRRLRNIGLHCWECSRNKSSLKSSTT